MCEEKFDINTIAQNTNGGILFTKTQQWNMANYSLLMQGAVIGAFELLWNSTDHEQILQWTRIVFAVLAIFASILVAVYSYRLFKAYKIDSSRYQEIYDKLSNREHNNFSKTFKDVIENYPELENEFYERPEIGKRNTTLIVKLHYRVSLIGTIFSVFYFCFKITICFV